VVLQLQILLSVLLWGRLFPVSSEIIFFVIWWCIVIWLSAETCVPFWLWGWCGNLGLWLLLWLQIQWLIITIRDYSAADKTCLVVQSYTWDIVALCLMKGLLSGLLLRCFFKVAKITKTIIWSWFLGLLLNFLSLWLNNRSWWSWERIKVKI